MLPSSTSSSDPPVLSPAEWLWLAAIVAGALALFSVCWQRGEKLTYAADYRLPWEKANDYYLFSRWARHAAGEYRAFVMGDSVIWGQEVRNDETIAHYLNQEAGAPVFANLGMDGLHPVAMDGLIRHYGARLRNRPILLQFNPTWMRNPYYDLQGDWTDFFHSGLVPQFWPRIACYHATGEARLSTTITRTFHFFDLVQHVASGAFGSLSAPQWMLKNPYRSPLTAMKPQPPALDVRSPGRGRSWNFRSRPPDDSPWLACGESLQWKYFVMAVKRLESRGNKVLVLMSPCNTYVLTPGSRDRALRVIREVQSRFDAMGIRYVTVDDIPSECFADEYGHLLKDGHIRLAASLSTNSVFRVWLKE